MRQAVGISLDHVLLCETCALRRMVSVIIVLIASETGYAVQYRWCKNDGAMHGSELPEIQ